MDKNTILLVDDLPMFLEIEKDFFKYSKVRVLTAKDGYEALDVMKSHKTDLVFMDLQMPNMDGATCCRKIKADPDLCKVPVALITSATSDQDKEDCFSAGCDYFLTKPASRYRFLEVAREFIPEIDRREKRKSCRFDCVINYDGTKISCMLYDLSAEGAFVVTDYTEKPPAIFEISFTLTNGATISCHSKLVWINEKSAIRPKGFGIKFALMPKEVKEDLRKFVNSQS
jgi:CheY-like chemotaxis protein